MLSSDSPGSKEGSVLWLRLVRGCRRERTAARQATPWAGAMTPNRRRSPSTVPAL